MTRSTSRSIAHPQDQTAAGGSNTSSSTITPVKTGPLVAESSLDPNRIRRINSNDHDYNMNENENEKKHKMIGNETNDLDPKHRNARSGLHNNAALWVCIWIVNNIGITLIDKVAFNEPIDFKYPYFLSAHHMAFIAMGTQVIFWILARQQQQRGATGAVTDGGRGDATTKAKQEDDERDQEQGKNNIEPNPCERGNSFGSTNSSNSDTHQSSTSTPSSSWLTTWFGDYQLQQQPKLDAKGRRTIVLYSIIFSANLCIGNVSIRHVSVNFNQVMRSLVPAVTIAMGFCIGKPTSWQRQVAVVPVMIGVALACMGDLSYTQVGFVYTALCVFLAALKVVASGELLTNFNGGGLHPFELLRLMTPLALVQCIFLSWVTGEIDELVQRWPQDFCPWTSPKGWYPMNVVNLTGVISLTFNISSLQVNKLTSPLTLCVAANVKQVLNIILATMIFDTQITPLNAVGIVTVLTGSAWYSYVSSMEKQALKQQQQQQQQQLQSRTLHEENGKNENRPGLAAAMLGAWQQFWNSNNSADSNNKPANVLKWSVCALALLGIVSRYQNPLLDRQLKTAMAPKSAVTKPALRQVKPSRTLGHIEKNTPQKETTASASSIGSHDAPIRSTQTQAKTNKMAGA